MKKLYYFYHERIPGEMFIDSEARFVGWYHENDASWRPGYMDFIVKHFGGEVLELNGYDLVDEEQELEEDPFRSAEDGEDGLKAWCDANKDMLLEAIRSRELPDVEDRLTEEENVEFESNTVVNHLAKPAKKKASKTKKAKPAKKTTKKPVTKTKKSKSKTKKR